jgi:hypothetical protein
MLRNKPSRARAAAAATLLSLSLAAPALADDDWGDRGERHGYPVHRHDRSCDHEGRHHGQWGDSRWSGGGHYGGRDHRGGRHYHGGRRHRHGASYGCRPCGRRWSSREPFHRHLAHAHRVPTWALPRVVVRTGWGWAFSG